MPPSTSDSQSSIDMSECSVVQSAVLVRSPQVSSTSFLVTSVSTSSNFSNFSDWFGQVNEAFSVLGGRIEATVASLSIGNTQAEVTSSGSEVDIGDENLR